MVIAYHARPYPEIHSGSAAGGLFDQDRNTWVKAVNMRANGMIDASLTKDQEVAPANRTVTVKVTVDKAPIPEPEPTVPVTGVTLNPTVLELVTGDTAALNATVTPENATNRKVAWSSSDESIATVDDSGTVTAAKAGTVTITVTTEDGEFVATATVTVKAKDSGGTPDSKPEQPSQPNNPSDSNNPNGSDGKGDDTSANADKSNGSNDGRILSKTGASVWGMVFVAMTLAAIGVSFASNQ